MIPPTAQICASAGPKSAIVKKTAVPKGYQTWTKEGLGQRKGGGGSRQLTGKLVRSLGKISGAAACCGMLRHAAACCGMLRHAAACFSLHLWVPTLLCQVELTCKRQHAQHCWAKLITFTIRRLQ